MRPEKLSLAQEIKSQMADAAFALFVDFTKMNTVQTAQLKAKLAESGAKSQVVPNRIFKIVAKELGWEGLDAALVGPTAVIFGAGEPVDAAKALKDFIKTAKLPAVKAGYVEGRALTAAEVDVLATLPGKKAMQGVFVGTLAAPMRNLVGVFSQKLASIVYVLKAAADKKGGDANDSPAA